MLAFFKALDQIVRFYRKNSPLALRWARTSFAQFGEDLFLNAFFRNQTRGFYVDVGAFHPFHFSNTYLCYKKGWRGINIEPDPNGIRLLKKHRKRDINLNIAISDQEAKVPFTLDAAFSGIHDSRHRFQNRNPQAQSIEVAARPLRTVLQQHLPPDTTIDFLSVDCEGHDLTVLKSNDWEQYRPRLVLVEDHSTKPESAIDAFLQTVHYHYYCRLHITKVFLEEKEARQCLPAPRYPSKEASGG